MNCVVDETERNIKLDADNTLEKLKGSLEGIIYNPDKKQVFFKPHEITDTSSSTSSALFLHLVRLQMFSLIR